MNGKKLLVADDSLTIQKVIRLALSNEGYEIQTVSDGNDALQQIAVFRPDVILVDVSLPGKNAFEIKHAMNELGEPVHAKFILMSSAFEAVDENEQARVGFDGRLTKPFDPANLRSVLTGVLRASAGSPSAAATPPPLPGAGSGSAEPHAPPIPSISLFSRDDDAGPEPIEILDARELTSKPERSAPPAPLPSPPLGPPPAPKAPSGFPTPEVELDLSSPPQLPPVQAPRAAPSFPPVRPSGFPIPDPTALLTPSATESKPWVSETGLNEFTSSFFSRPEDLPIPQSTGGKPPLDPGADPTMDYSDIRHLTESTIRLSGLDEFQWSVSETGKKLPGPASDPVASYQRSEYAKPALESGTRDIQKPEAQDLSSSLAAEAYHRAPETDEPAPAPAESHRPGFAQQADPNVMPVSVAEMQEVMRKQMEETLTRMAERLLPEIAEKIIRQEIRKMLSEQP